MSAKKIVGSALVITAAYFLFKKDNKEDSRSSIINEIVNSGKLNQASLNLLRSKGFFNSAAIIEIKFARDVIVYNKKASTQAEFKILKGVQTKYNLFT